MLHGRFVHVGKNLTYLQILGCELHQNAFGGRAPPGPAIYSVPPDPLAVIRGKGRRGMGRKRLEIGREGKG